MKTMSAPLSTHTHTHTLVAHERERSSFPLATRESFVFGITERNVCRCVRYLSTSDSTNANYPLDSLRRCVFPFSFSLYLGARIFGAAATEDISIIITYITHTTDCVVCVVGRRRLYTSDRLAEREERDRRCAQPQYRDRPPRAAKRSEPNAARLAFVKLMRIGKPPRYNS